MYVVDYVMLLGQEFGLLSLENCSFPNKNCSLPVKLCKIPLHELTHIIVVKVVESIRWWFDPNFETHNFSTFESIFFGLSKYKG